MNYTDKFLDSYKQLEAELKFSNMSVLDYENSIQDNEKLRVCRIMRNYLSHNDTTFIAPTAEQVKFIDKTIVDLRKAAHTVKDEMKRTKTVKANELIKNILPIIDKVNYVPVETADGIYLVDKAKVIHELVLGNKKLTIPKRLPKYKTTNKNERIENLTNDVYIVYDNDKYVGILDNTL